MKRLIHVSVILVLIILLTACSYIKIDLVTQQMISKLNTAYLCNNAENFEGAKNALDDFFEIYERNKLLFTLYVRRDLLYNVQTTSASLYEYANTTNKNDFNADCQKTIEHINVIRNYVLTPA